MALILVRHTTPLVAAGTCYGRTDLPLAESFEAEAATVARALAAARAGLPATGPILSSPLSRCRRLAERLGPHDLHDGFVEMDFGAWEGQPWDAIPRAELDLWAEDFLGARPHGGESVAALRDRVADALEGLPDGAVVVTHAGVIKAAAAILNHPEGWDIRPAFGAVLVFQ
jgi:alpha-ribazole phosphatase